MRQRATKSTTERTSKKSGARRRTTRTRSTSHRNSHGRRKWSAGVTTESTYPQEGLFKKDAATIARRLASKEVSPKGPSSGMRMLTFFINRAGKNLSASRRRVLERAKELLHERIEKRKAATTRSGRKSTQSRRRSHK